MFCWLGGHMCRVICDPRVPVLSVLSSCLRRISAIMLCRTLADILTQSRQANPFTPECPITETPHPQSSRPKEHLREWSVRRRRIGRGPGPGRPTYRGVLPRLPSSACSPCRVCKPSLPSCATRRPPDLCPRRL